jgi:antiviral helicase SLH1
LNHSELFVYIIAATLTPIRFRGGLIDALNAEIALGTVANTRDAVQWLGYTYLFVRMRKNPFVYGLDHDALVHDPSLGVKRHELISAGVKKLVEVNMVVHDKETGTLSVTDMGRIAAKYYVRHASVEIFNQVFQKRMTEADVLSMLSMSTEFDQVQLRESEVQELKNLVEIIPCDVKERTPTRGKSIYCYKLIYLGIPSLISPSSPIWPMLHKTEVV